MPTYKLKAILQLLLTPEFEDVIITPTNLIDLFLRCKTTEREDFLHYLKKHITSKERSILIGTTPD